MARKPTIEEENDEPTAPFWMSTFSDMATLLMTFFILIVAMSEVEVKKFEEALSYFQGRPSFLTHDAVIPAVQQDQAKESKAPALEQAKRYEELMKRLREKGLDAFVEVSLTERGLHVRMTDSVMFAPGKAQLQGLAVDVLGEVSAVLGEDIESVQVEGHTDDRPIRSVAYPSNWELSAARAAAVVRHLLTLDAARPPERYRAVGHGEFHPLESNATAAGRARNRRVEILFSTEPWQSPTFRPPSP